MTVKDVLMGARELLAKGWIQRDWARNLAGDSVLWSDPAATHFCSMGAIGRMAGDSSALREGAREAFMDANDLERAVADWNDAPGRTQAEVLAAFDKAIAEQP